jgi:peptidoglycan/LPS O-acetylase OafA/YrhL
MREAIQSHGKLNNFDGLRLLAALLVLFSHQFVFLGKPEPAPAGDSLGMIAVMMFFVMSGYLVSESWYRDPHLMRFASRRFLRVWPALAAAAVAIALVSAAVTVLPLHDYFGSATRKFILANFKFETIYRLPGVFDTVPANPSLSAVNGSWWTIPVEARCYAYVAVLGAIGMRRRLFSIMALGLVALMYVKTLPGHSKADAFANISFLYIAFFMTGVCARQYIEEIRRHRLAFMGTVAIAIVAAFAFDQPRVGEWAVIAPLTLIAGPASTPIVRSAARFGDLSYGIYLYAYFLQQLTVRLWPGQPTFGATIIIATLATVIVAWCSWHAVEAPSLRLKRRLGRWFPDAVA